MLAVYTPTMPDPMSLPFKVTNTILLPQIQQTGIHTEFSWADRGTELSRAQGEGDYLSVSHLLSLVVLLAVGLFSLTLKRLSEDNMSQRHMCVCKDSIMQLTFLTRSQGTAHGRAAKVDKHTLLWRWRRNPHDQSGRPGDTQPVGDEEMDMAGVGVEGERKEAREKQGGVEIKNGGEGMRKKIRGWRKRESMHVKRRKPWVRDSDNIWLTVVTQKSSKTLDSWQNV